LNQKLNASLGCYGCREATNLAEDESVMGFSINDLKGIVNSLLALKDKTISRVRGKAVFEAYYQD